MRKLNKGTWVITILSTTNSRFATLHINILTIKISGEIDVFVTLKMTWIHILWYEICHPFNNTALVVPLFFSAVCTHNYFNIAIKRCNYLGLTFCIASREVSWSWKWCPNPNVMLCFSAIIWIKKICSRQIHNRKNKK